MKTDCAGLACAWALFGSMPVLAGSTIGGICRFIRSEKAASVDTGVIRADDRQGIQVAEPQPPPLRVRRYELASRPYQDLLRDYLRHRLSLDPKKPDHAKLADDIIRAADDRFAYVSFLADRAESGQLAAGEIGQGANHGPSGSHDRNTNVIRWTLQPLTYQAFERQRQSNDKK
jgi:hypothetical protein